VGCLDDLRTKDSDRNSGLGLSISFEIIAAHNGKLLLDETKKHTTLKIELPIFKNQKLQKAS